MSQEAGRRDRSRILREVETQLLLDCRRRCCLCVYLTGDLSQKQVQIAHISRDPSNSRAENLVVLCLDHHDQYDSSTSQSKGLTPDEVRHYKNRLTDLIRRWDRAPHQIVVPHALVADLTVGAMSTQYLQTSPLPSGEQSLYDRDATLLLAKLLDPVHSEEKLRLLVEHDFVAGDIDCIETVIVRTKPHPSMGKPYCIVLISNRSGWTWDVLFFLEREGKWDRIGRIPLAGQKGYEPSIVYIAGESNGVLSVEHIAGYGTGIFQKIATWYRVGSEGLVPLFSYPIRAYVVGWGLPFQRHITGQADIPHILEAGSRVKIVLDAEYSADPSWLWNHQITKELPLFSYTAQLILEWDKDARAFLPTNDSTATFDQVEGLFNDDTNSFLKRYKTEIVNLVKKGEKLEHDWVRDILKQSAPSEERLLIETLLNQEAHSGKL